MKQFQSLAPIMHRQTRNSPVAKKHPTDDDVTLEESPSKKRRRHQNLVPFTPPSNWRSVYDRLHEFRYNSGQPATPVDTMGCDRLTDTTAEPRVQRFHILVSLMLSSQTKDQVTAAAVNKLHRLQDYVDGKILPQFPQPAFGDGHVKTQLTIQNVLAAPVETINACIAAVGFHNKKAVYLKQIAQILYNKYDEDIPRSADDLMALPGVGPKMAYLALQCAWHDNAGIGVDTHVHRIASRLKWVPKGTQERGPEATRLALEDWLPRELWPKINHLLVGMGQSVCTPLRPKCADCPINDTCPSSTVKKNKTQGDQKA